MGCALPYVLPYVLHPMGCALPYVLPYVPHPMGCILPFVLPYVLPYALPYVPQFGFSTKQQTSPIGLMSDGQRSRLVFAMLAMQVRRMARNTACFITWGNT